MKHYIALAFWTTIFCIAVAGPVTVYGYLHKWDIQLGINLDREGAQNVQETVLLTRN